MEQETPQKLFGGHGHQPLLALVGIIFPAEGDLAIRKFHNAVIGDGNAMRVAGHIVEDMFGSSEWPFGVNYPILTKQWPQKSMEGFFFGEVFQAARVGRLTGAVSSVASSASAGLIDGSATATDAGSWKWNQGGVTAVQRGSIGVAAAATNIA